MNHKNLEKIYFLHLLKLRNNFLKNKIKIMLKFYCLGKIFKKHL